MANPAVQCCRDKGSVQEKEEPESFEEREHTRHATGDKLEEVARLQRLAQAQVSSLQLWACLG